MRKSNKSVAVIQFVEVSVMSVWPKQIDKMFLEVELNDRYAFYKSLSKFGFMNGLEVRKISLKGHAEHSLYEIHRLSGNSWGKGNWIVIRTEHFRDFNHFLQVVNGETYVPKRCRKPKPIEPLDQESITRIEEEWANILTASGEDVDSLIKKQNVKS